MINLRQAVVLLLLPVLHAAAQDVPAASAAVPYTGFTLPDASGTLRMSLNVSERVSFGYDGSNGTSNGVSCSGIAAYLSGSPSRPFSAVYTASYVSDGGNSSNGLNQPTRVLSTLAMSQVLQFGRWNFVAADSVSYTPENPVAGLTGVPGLGDGNTGPLAGSTTGEQIQTVETTVLQNRVSGTASYSLSAATRLSVTSSQSIFRYLDVPGGSTADLNAWTFSGGLTQSIDPFTSVGLRYSYSKNEYLASDLSGESQSILVNASRTLTPSLSVSGSIGPQFSSSSRPDLEPSTVSYSASGGLTYHNSFLNASISASRGIDGGAGLIGQSESSTVTGRVNRQIGTLVNLSANAGYGSYSSLQIGNGSTHSLIVGGQANRAIAAHLSAFASYTAQRQLSQGNGVSTLVLNGTTQTLSFGISYAPNAIRIGQQ